MAWYSRFFPVGSLARSKLDWSLDTAMACAGYSIGPQAGPLQVDLYNNATDGRSLAVWAVLPFYTANPKWVQMFTGQGHIGALYSPAFPLSTLAGVQPGQVYGGWTATLPPIPPMYVAMADGKRWLRNGGAPLAVISPGYTFYVYAGYNIGGSVVDFWGSLFVTFVWTPA